MSYKTTREIKSLARGGVSLGAHRPCTPQAFTPTLWAALIKEGAIVEIAPPDEVQELEKTTETENETQPEIYATPAAIELADEHGIDLQGVAGTGRGGKITLSDVRGIVEDLL